MPTPLNRDESATGQIDSAFRGPGIRSWLGRIAPIVISLGALTFSACKKQAAPVTAETSEERTEQPTVSLPLPSATPAAKKKDSWEGYAVWYDVPVNSLAKRRAGKGELTAAHNRLRLGSMVRVTHLASGKSVIVRITDRGIITRANIDLCKEAAEELGMIREGRARVRLEVLPDDKGINAVPESTGTVAHP